MLVLVLELVLVLMLVLQLDGATSWRFHAQLGRPEGKVVWGGSLGRVTGRWGCDKESEIE